MGSAKVSRPAAEPRGAGLRWSAPREAAPRERGRLATAATLGALFVSAVPGALVTGAALLARAALPRPRVPAPSRVRTVLVTGGRMTKALALARAFSAVGHRVVLVESERYGDAPHRHSFAVAAFQTVPDPRVAPDAYVAALVSIARDHAVDAFVPVSSPASAVLDAEAGAAMDPRVDVVHGSPGDVRMLDDKHAFCERARALDLPAPDVHRVTSADEVLGFDLSAAPGERYVLKSIQYDPVARLRMPRLPCGDPAEAIAGLDVSEQRPFVLQEFVEGEEFCTHGVARDGRLLLHICSRSSAFQVNYAHVDVPAIEAWVRDFVARAGLTGQVSFDFIVDDAGRALPIECNPRTHSAVTAFEDGLAAAYLGMPAATLRPDAARPPAHWLAHEAARIASAGAPRRALSHLRELARGRDAVFRWRDPLPFFALHFLYVPRLLLGSLRSGRPWLRIDFNIGKLVEAGGD